jgi:(E)-4-hydroxy-3-methylbut-2-enyl-diphosphate synthase
VALTIASYRLLSQAVSYPLHLGVTEAGTEYAGIVKSAVGIGALLAEGIGDTIRVSLTAPPEREIKAGLAILKALGLRKIGAELISCPTCGRTKIDLIPIAEEVERRLSLLDKPINVAVMGCAVNGPGEASRADFGIAGGDREGVLFKKGAVVKKVPMESLVDELFMLIDEQRDNF